MTETLKNLTLKIAADLQSAQLGFAMLCGYLEGVQQAEEPPGTADPQLLLPKTAHIEGDEDMQKLKYGDGCITPRHRKLKDGRIRRFYEGRIYNNGKQVSVYAATKTECIAKLAALRREREEERRELRKLATTSERGERSGVPFRNYGEWLDTWVNEYKLHKLRDSYVDEFKRQVSTVRAALGDLPIRKIEPLELMRYVNSLPRCNTTVKLFDIINGSLQKAEDFGIIKRNPCKALDRPTYEKQKRRAFELSEQVAILDALPERYAAVFFFLCCTGLRIGEFLALSPESIDYTRHYIRVEATQNLKSGEHGKTKTQAGERNIYFAGSLFTKFDAATLGTYSYNGIKKALCKVYKVLNLSDISVTHSCRHTFASMLYAVGVPDKIIQRQLGHASVSTTMDVYTDILMSGSSPILDYVKELKNTLISTLLLS